MKRKLALLGPAVIVGAWQFGPGNLTTSSSAGASLGYSLIWVIVLSTIFMLVYTDISVRMGLAFQDSIVQVIKGKLGNVVAILTAVGIFLVALSFQVGNAAGSGIGLTLLFGGNVGLWAVVSTLVALGLLWARSYYKTFERLMIGLVGVMLTVFVITAFLAEPDWGEVGKGFIPNLPAETGLLIIALVGTNFSVTAAFYTGYAIREKGTSRDQYRETTLTDTLAGVIAPGIMTIMVIVAAAAVLQPQGETVESPADMARILEPTVGPLASTIFAVGIFGAAFSSFMAAATAGGSLLSDALGWGNQLSSKRVKVVITAVMLFGAAVTVIFGGSPIQLIITAQALTILVVPFVGLVMLLLANDESRMGSLANSRWQNVLGVLGWLALLAIAIRLIIVLFP